MTTPPPLPPPLGSAARPAVPSEAWAQVHARDRVTRYLRRGTGRPAVALADAADPDPRWPELVDGLAARFRTVLPEVPVDGGEEFAVWLGGFLDGICCPPVALVAAGRLCAPVLEFALLDGGRVDRVALVPRDAAEEARLLDAAGALRAETSVLVVRRSAARGELVPRLLRFLAPDAPG